MLSLLRPLADEIVVAVDSRVPVSLTGTLYRGVADKLLRYEYAPPVERPFAWMHAQCTGDWILRIDSDEVPSTDLLAALPSLIRARDVHQFPLQRRWLLSDLKHGLNEAPWWPDYQFRLVRNDPATLWFAGISHSSAHPARPARYLDIPVYHLDCVLNSYDARSVKVARYESRTNREVEGAIANAIFYLPEDHHTEPLAVIPYGDRALIGQVFNATSPSTIAPVGTGEIGLADREAIDAYWEERPLPDEGRRATLQLIEHDCRLLVGERRSFHIRLHNSGTETWPYGPLRHPAVTVCYRWLHPGGATAIDEGLHSPLTADVSPSTTTVVPTTVDAPKEAGTYLLEVDLVYDRREWFGTPTLAKFEISPPSASYFPLKKSE
jgi:hypothetical protein